MAFREKIQSFISDSILFGVATATRVRLKNSGGVLEVRNNADAAYIVGRGADPVGDDDWVTLRYFNNNPPVGGGLQILQYTITAAGGAVQDSVYSIPAGNVVYDAWEDVTVAWSPGSTIDVGNTATSNLLIDNADVDEGSVDTYIFPQRTTWPISSVVRATIAGVPVAGTSVITIFYGTPRS